MKEAADAFALLGLHIETAADEAAEDVDAELGCAAVESQLRNNIDRVQRRWNSKSPADRVLIIKMFFDDAVLVSRTLELTLTGRDCGNNMRAPMCGVPYHAAMTYISKLVSKGYKVAVCEQLEDPALAKGIVKRDIVRIYSPGTVLEDQMLTSSVNNYIVSICSKKGIYGFAAADISTGEMRCTSLTIGTTARRLAGSRA